MPESIVRAGPPTRDHSSTVPSDSSLDLLGACRFPTKSPSLARSPTSSDDDREGHGISLNAEASDDEESVSEEADVAEELLALWTKAPRQIDSEHRDMNGSTIGLEVEE